ncbi:DNA polymerase III subunit gamma/tau [Shewanella sp. SW36]|uniref:DNA polymerase III subunit gamma/tau n=2 Tax=Shewanella TaxID=22 RepID=UPI0021D955D4|nr:MULTISPECIES: DNA polymerase III subunit gamma/tau [unclassified Shewanella]MCU7974946.1 DNA polymerase III subunit gamma/tau [Shewanella sp. SW36]MCU7990335.1 DNA polymerase III subunit gamma/tau [Shewanella sp. SW1]MCU8016892.1 DNA polymerase III subunit gamma/tau [Shewanella sp. SM72]MCU8052793.1 DNA polymerase III subunit gamma/tau [Shewanella sp. SM43]
MSNHGMLSFKVLGAHAPAFVSHTLGSSMSYQVLARKWRPATFDQMVGQSHVLHALTNALSQQRLHHAYLFTGTRGVGKTSLARLFAKGLNCEQGVTATPCGVCGSCVEIAQGRFVDLIEVDAASRTKVDDTRELLDNVQYRPTRGRFKVYLIDEVHMLSRSSFNALLKTLEEPPEHVKFLLATTDPQKLPVTVLSRCLQFNLKSLTQAEIGTQLNHILTQEQFPFDVEALKLLAKAANGSMRDALSLTDQAIAFGGGNVMLGQVQTMLGSIDEQHVVALLKALTDADIGVLMHTCAQVLAYGADAQEVLRSLLELLHQITLTQFAPACAQQSLYSAQIRAFAEQLKPEQVQLYYQILLTGRKDLPHAPDPKSGLEMALLRAVAFVPEKPVKRWQPDAVAEISLSEGQTPVATAQAHDVKEQKFAEPHTAEQLPAEKKTALIEPADTAEQALDAELQADAALIAEQAVILSQAQSQGFNAGSLSLNVEIVNAEVEPQTQTVSTAQASLIHTSESVAGIEVSVASIDTQNIQGIELVTIASKPSLVNTAEPETAVNSTVVECGDSVDKALFDKDLAAENIFDNNIDNNAFELGHDANRIHGNEAEHSYSAMEDYALESAPLDSYQDVYADFSSGAYNDDNFNHGFDSKEAINSVDVQSSVGVSNAAGMQASADRQSAPVAQVFTQSQTSVSDSIQDQALQQAASVSLADDDILSAVLAARDSLLSDLDALSAKDGDEKKSSLDSKLKTPNTKSHCVTLPKSVTKIEASQPSVAFSVDPASDLDPDLAIDFDDDFDLDLEPIDLHQAVSSVVISTGIVSDKPVKPSAADDRPPWEAAPEAESIEVTQVDSNKTDSVQPVSAQAADIKNVQASHAQELLGVSYAPNHAQDDTLSLSDGQVAASSLKSEILQNQAVRQEEIPASEFALASTTALTNASNTVEHTQETQVALSSTQPISGHPLDLHWYKLMASLEIGGRVRQLAVNSVCQTLSDPLPLLLKPNQKHLAADVAIVQLEQALTTALGNPRRVQVVIGIDEQRETPLELRKRFHQELLQQAHQSLIHDDNVQWLIQRMGAELDADSLVYPPELLNLRSQQIQALPELTEAAS